MILHDDRVRSRFRASKEIASGRYRQLEEFNRLNGLQITLGIEDGAYVEFMSCCRRC